MVHVRVSDEYIKFALMYTTHHIFSILPVKPLVNYDFEPTTPHKLETGKKPSLSNIHVQLFPCVVQKTTARVDGKALNMHHQPQICFWGIFVGIP